MENTRTFLSVLAIMGSKLTSPDLQPPILARVPLSLSLTLVMSSEIKHSWVFWLGFSWYVQNFYIPYKKTMDFSSNGLDLSLHAGCNRGIYKGLVRNSRAEEQCRPGGVHCILGGGIVPKCTTVSNWSVIKTLVGWILSGIILAYTSWY